MTQEARGDVPAATPRFEAVDFMRGLSILAVVLLHIWLRFFLNGVLVGTGLPKWLSHLLLRNGGNGVTVFFAISGFPLSTGPSFTKISSEGAASVPGPGSPGASIKKCPRYDFAVKSSKHWVWLQPLRGGPSFEGTYGQSPHMKWFSSEMRKGRSWSASPFRKTFFVRR